VLGAPDILFDAGACEPTSQGGCGVFVIHSVVKGAVRYVMVSAAKVEVPCNAVPFIPNGCLGVFASAPGCTVLKAVDAAGNRGPSSEPFCVPRPSAS
jgi:hypothetical protein